VSGEKAAGEGGRYRYVTRERWGANPEELCQNVETGALTVNRRVALDGVPLTGENAAAEDARLQALVEDRDEQRRQAQKQREQNQLIRRLIAASPDAFLFELVEQGYDRKKGGWVRLRFEPDPAYDPPDNVTAVLTGMTGTMDIDTAAGRITRVEGRLLKRVSFGWGIFGRLERGGRILFEQARLPGGRWEIVTMDLDLQGSALLGLKRIDIRLKRHVSDAEPLPKDFTVQEAVEHLRGLAR